MVYRVSLPESAVQWCNSGVVGIIFVGSANILLTTPCSFFKIELLLLWDIGTVHRFEAWKSMVKATTIRQYNDSDKERDVGLVCVFAGATSGIGARYAGEDGTEAGKIHLLRPRKISTPVRKSTCKVRKSQSKLQTRVYPSGSLSALRHGCCVQAYHRLRAKGGLFVHEPRSDPSERATVYALSTY